MEIVILLTHEAILNRASSTKLKVQSSKYKDLRPKTNVLRQFAQSFLELVTMVAGERQLRTVFQDDAVFSMEPGL